MKKKRKNILLIAGMLLVLLVGILAYSAYTQKEVYQESTANLLSTYGQSAKTFTMFAQRNWNILTDWDSYLCALAESGEQEGQWQEYIAQKATWQYTDFYLFNEQCEFWTTAGRQGTAEHMRATFEELYTANAPVITSYTSSQGIRKVMFAMPMEQPLQLGDTTYTALAVSYDNAVLEKLLSSMVYEGQSDCYVVRSDGEVVLSTEVKTVIAELMANLFDYLQQNASVDQPYFDTMVQTLPQGGEGCVLFTMNGQKYYLIYQPLGILDWSIIGIVPTGVVDAGMRRVQMATIFIITLHGLLIMAGVIKILRDAERNRRRDLERRREKSDMMFEGMARVVERYAVCDLDRDRYQYYERHGEALYPPEGSYQQLLEQISRKYVVLTDSENAKIPQMLAPENLRRLIKTDKDSLKLEYAARDKSAFFMMTVVPMAWKGDRLTRVMMITQDMGKQHLLQSLANTDGLTGLLNKRYFDRVLTVLEQHCQPFALFYMDLDRFKPVNDTYGHDVGDKLLKGVAQRLQGCIRSRDYAFRLGGDEFALLLFGPMTQETCARKMDMICEMIAVPYEIDGNAVSVGASCGYALYPAESIDVQQVCYIADQRMYENKQKNHARQDGAEGI
ncbi:sensor domain-containing diguanylate cyclase [uncultured Faecalibacterium sp.]|uniref:sensor domain-containing diguanylate cyclase n=1 Tax=uncultured Faecalibacterium sp. TaxID=259315 RepID=UPI002804FBA3|nr:sensor domain-containing diguanylate cyclase [uncultured Faecalibacterium sp.]